MRNSIKKLVLATVTAAAITAPVALSAPAQADPGSPGRVTRAEFSKIRHGMTVAQVARIFGTNGKQSFYYDGTYIPDEMDREYKGPSMWDTVEVDFYRIGGVWKVHGKYWF